MMPAVSIIHNEEPINEQTFQFLLRFSPPEKQQRILRQKIKQNADNMVIGGALARHMLWNEFHIPLGSCIAYGEFGKPYLSDYPEVHFNISHSGQYVACAVCNRPIGVDVQIITPYHPDVAMKVCSNLELAQINASSNHAEEFTKIWTKKEAYAKQLGFGISNNLNYNSFSSHGIISKYIGDAILSISV